MNRDNDLRAKLQARHHQHMPKGKRPAAIVSQPRQFAAGTAVAVKRQKLDQIPQRKVVHASSNYASHIQGTSIITQNQQKNHFPFQHPAKQIIKQSNNKPPILPVETVRKDQSILPTEKPQQSLKNDLIQAQIQEELQILADSAISFEMIPDFNEEYFSKLPQTEMIKALQTFAIHPKKYSQMIELIIAQKYHLEKDTLWMLMPFLRAYQMIGANGIDKFLAHYSE